MSNTTRLILCIVMVCAQITPDVLKMLKPEKNVISFKVTFVLFGRLSIAPISYLPPLARKVRLQFADYTRHPLYHDTHPAIFC